MQRVVVAAGVALALAVPAQLSAGARSEGDRVKAVLLTQARLLRQGRFRVMYRTTYTPAFRTHCPWRTYLKRQRFGRSYLGPGFSVHNVRVRILSSTRALLAYRFVRANGQIAANVTFRQRDLYAKLGGRWYDEYDSVSDC
jgi:hypothetical protein